MKKFVFFVSALFLTGSLALAKPVNSTTAMQVAENFYKGTTHNEVNTIALVYTSTNSKGAALYYAYNVNSGFVIVTADDAAFPVIGYSTERTFEIPEVGSTIGTWLKKRGEEIALVQEKDIAASLEISKKWSDILHPSAERQNNSVQNVVTPLVNTTWNQSPYYNAMCPGGSVTGCVATAMAQIMKYWNYPATGTGSSSYNSNYGTLSADYGNTTYNWSNMPTHLTGANSDVALINFHCGVSVDMDYSPSGSGAWVCSFDNPVCAQNSYKDYFKYDANTIDGLDRANYDDPTWIGLMKTDLDLGRPIQYVGWDPNEGGHTWVCDGYDQNDYLHMNWGWGGQGNGYYFVNSLNPSGFNFSDGHQAVIGIVPVAATSIDASVPTVFNPNGFYCTNTFSPVVKLQNLGGTTLTSCDITYAVDNGALQTQSWTGSLVTGQFASVSLPSITATPGSHTIVVSSSNPNAGTDGNSSNDQASVVFHVANGGTLPVVEGFENGIAPATWAVSSTGAGANFSSTSSAAATGSNSAMLDNMSNAPGSTSILETTASYDLASVSQPVLVFKMAYQQKSASNNDKLQVFLSDNCGAAWVSKWARMGSGISTVSGASTSAFVPTASQFHTYTVNISSLASSHNVIFRWKFFADPNGPGNNLYIDDINIVSSVTGVASIEDEIGLNVHPNPSAGSFHVTMNDVNGKTIAVSVADMLGRVIESRPAKTYGAEEAQFVFGEKTTYQPGIYFVNLEIDGKLVSKKVVVN
jgi:hypothetical protein